MKSSKCEFFGSWISYLGHIVSKEGIETGPKNISAICHWLQPQTVTEVQSFLGFTNYYRKFIHKYVQIAKPLNTLVSGKNAKSKKKLVECNEDCKTAYQKLKTLCSETHILAYANYSMPVCLQTDASEKDLGAVLYEIQNDGTTRVIAYASRTLSKSQTNYDAQKLEFLALKWAITDRFHEYLYAGNFEVFTDNSLLTYLLSTVKLDAMDQRWVMSLTNNNFKLHYKIGKLNVEVDQLSRIPWEQEETLDVLDLLQSRQ